MEWSGCSDSEWHSNTKPFNIQTLSSLHWPNRVFYSLEMKKTYFLYFAYFLKWLTVGGSTQNVSLPKEIQARIAQLVAYRLGTGFKSRQGREFSMKIGNWLNSNLIGAAKKIKWSTPTTRSDTVQTWWLQDGMVERKTPKENLEKIIERKIISPLFKTQEKDFQ